MSGPSEEDRWHRALERLGPEIQRAKFEPENSPAPSPAPARDAPPEPVVDPLIHEGSAVAVDSSRLQSVRYWAGVAGAAALIAAITGLLALLPMSMR
jgi:hypothetical protein